MRRGSKRRKPARPQIDVQSIITVADRITRELFRLSTEEGYVVTGGRAYRRKDGTWTARIVMRNREAVISTLTLTVQGLVLA